MRISPVGWGKSMESGYPADAEFHDQSIGTSAASVALHIRKLRPFFHSRPQKNAVGPHLELNISRRGLVAGKLK